jgi:energy-coupling factor transport system permease protein
VTGGAGARGRGAFGVERRASRGRARRRELHLLRYVPGHSPLHRAWAGSKLLTALGLSVAASVNPSWPGVGALAAVTVLGLALARLPRGSLPRPPRWFVAGLALGALLALAAGGGSAVNVGGVSVGLGGLDAWARFTVLVLSLLVVSALVALTTPMAELGPALARLLGPLRRLGAPVDELVAAVTLSVRSLAFLLDEVRVLAAARRVRRPPRRPDWREALDEVVDLLVTAMVVATRRAGEVAEAIEARGGGARVAPSSPRRLDLVVLAVAALAVTGIVLA